MNDEIKKVDIVKFMSDIKEIKDKLKSINKVDEAQELAEDIAKTTTFTELDDIAVKKANRFIDKVQKFIVDYKIKTIVLAGVGIASATGIAFNIDYVNKIIEQVFSYL